MTILNLEEHQKCFNFECEKNRTIEIKKIDKDEVWETKAVEARLLFITKGGIYFEDMFQKGCHLNQERLILIPSNEKIKVYGKENSELIVFRIHKKIQLCPCFPLEILMRDKPKQLDTSQEIQSLEVNEILKTYLEHLTLCLNMEIKCKYYCNLKLDELFLLLRLFYSKDQLVTLFSNLLSPDISFSDYIIQNHYKYHTLNELAQSMNYSISGFEKRFKKVFGVSCYKWMKQQKTNRVFEAICSDSKNFKEIAVDLGFTSESYFYDFCKTQIGLTPSQIRKKKSLSL